VDDQQVQCPWHQSTFSLEDGSILQGPATAPQPSNEVRLRDGAVEVRERRPVARGIARKRPKQARCMVSHPCGTLLRVPAKQARRRVEAERDMS
jgi:hypothetical protein